MARMSGGRADYDPVAAGYAEHFRDELAAKPFDTTLLGWLADRVADRGRICDLGCGPGQVAGHLATRGVDVCGIDLSAEMVRHARYEHPGVEFAQGDMLDLSGVADGSFGGVAAFYSIVHFEPEQLPRAFAEIRRVLVPGGVALISFHVGDHRLHVDEMLGATVSLDFVFHDPHAVAGALRDAGLVVTEVIQRDPYAEHVEHQSRRAYLFATVPDPTAEISREP